MKKTWVKKIWMNKMWMQLLEWMKCELTEILALQATYFNASLPCLGVDKEVDGNKICQKERHTERKTKRQRERKTERETKRQKGPNKERKKKVGYKKDRERISVCSWERQLNTEGRN